MTDDLSTWPPDFEAVRIASISHVAFEPSEQNTIILFISDTGQKIALVAKLADLQQVVAACSTTLRDLMDHDQATMQ